MAGKMLLNGVLYDDVPKLLQKIPILYWIELEEQAGISTDDLDAGLLSMRRTAAAWAYLLRRNAGEAVTYKQAAVELILEDALVMDESDDDDADDGAESEADPNPDALSSPSDD